jgi:helicase MOV-10
VGKDAREGNSPSWFNVDEAKLVGAYVRALLDMRPNRPDPKDIGIITPYRKQVSRTAWKIFYAR